MTPNHGIERTVVIPWCNRRELARTLRENACAFRRGSAEIIVVNCGGDGHLLKTVIDRAAPGRITIAHVRRRCFNKGLALNIGVWLARGRVVSCLDSDVIVRPMSFAKAATVAANGRVVTVREIRESDQAPAARRSWLTRVSHVMRLEVEGGRRCDVETSCVNLHRGTRSAPGLITLRREDFVAVGGMNSSLTGWGWEDMDLLVRLRLGLGKQAHKIGTAVHLTHGWRVRSAYNEPRNRVAAFDNYRAGRWRGSYNADVRAWQARVIVEPRVVNPQSGTRGR
jgi:glycosyltransferase involved in cell wall biosynthesis